MILADSLPLYFFVFSLDYCVENPLRPAKRPSISKHLFRSLHTHTHTQAGTLGRLSMRLYLCGLRFVWLVWFCHYNCLRFPPFNEGPLLLRTRHKRSCSSSSSRGNTGTGWQKSCQQIFCCFQMLHNKHFSVLAIELSTQFFIVPFEFCCFEDN